MALYRLTVIMNGRKHGWSESHVVSRTNTTSGAVAASIVAWLNARAQLLGREYVVEGCRVSKIRDDLGNPVKRNVFPLEQQFKPANQTVANAGEFIDTSIVVRAVNLDGTKSKLMHFGGPPDDVTLNGGEFTKDKVNWEANFDAWNLLSLQNGIGWLSYEFLREVRVTDYIETEAGPVRFTVAAPGFEASTIGTQMTVRVRQLNNSKSILNRALELYIVDGTTAETVKSMAVGPFINQGWMTLYTQPSTFVAAAGWAAEKTGRRQRGRPLWVSPGRAKNRPLT